MFWSKRVPVRHLPACTRARSCMCNTNLLFRQHAEYLRCRYSHVHNEISHYVVRGTSTRNSKYKYSCLETHSHYLCIVYPLLWAPSLELWPRPVVSIRVALVDHAAALWTVKWGFVLIQPHIGKSSWRVPGYWDVQVWTSENLARTKNALFCMWTTNFLALAWRRHPPVPIHEARWFQAHWCLPPVSNWQKCCFGIKLLGVSVTRLRDCTMPRWWRRACLAFCQVRSPESDQMLGTPWILAGFDFPFIFPEHEFLKESGRVKHICTCAGNWCYTIQYAFDMQKNMHIQYRMTMHILEICIFADGVTMHISKICILGNKLNMHILKNEYRWIAVTMTMHIQNSHSDSHAICIFVCWLSTSVYNIHVLWVRCMTYKYSTKYWTRFKSSVLEYDVVYATDSEEHSTTTYSTCCCRKVRPRTSARYCLYVEATRKNLKMPDLPVEEVKDPFMGDGDLRHEFYMYSYK